MNVVAYAKYSMERIISKTTVVFLKWMYFRGNETEILVNQPMLWPRTAKGVLRTFYKGRLMFSSTSPPKV